MMFSQNTEALADEIAPLVRYLRPKVASAEDADDLAQEAFLRMHKFQQSGSLQNARAFLFKTAQNLAVDQRRRERVHLRFVTSEPTVVEDDPERDDSAAPSAEREASARQELARITEAIDGMPTKVRQAFLLHRAQGMSYGQIATEMQVSVSMVEKYIVRALRLLRDIA